MARIRTIKPEIRNSESMGRVSRDARLLFMLLFTEVDDYGRCRAASRMLASVLFPYDDDAKGLIDGWLAELARERCLRLYEVDGSHYLEICNWLKHQKIDHPSKSKFPGPSDLFSEPLASPREDFASVSDDFGNPRASRARGLDQGKGSRIKEEDLDLERERKARELSRGGAEDSPVTKNGLGDWPPDYREQFTAGYPNKVGMVVALKALDAAHAGGRVSWGVVIEALESYAAKTDDRAWLNPKRWIEEERWNDRPAKPTNGTAKPTAGDRARRLARQVEAREREGADRRPADAVGGAELGGDDARLVPGRKGPPG